MCCSIVVAVLGHQIWISWPEFGRNVDLPIEIQASGIVVGALHGNKSNGVREAPLSQREFHGLFAFFNEAVIERLPLRLTECRELERP